MKKAQQLFPQWLIDGREKAKIREFMDGEQPGIIDLTWVVGNGREAIYLGNDLIEQGSRVDIEKVIASCINFEHRVANDDWLEDFGGFPKSLDVLEFEEPPPPIGWIFGCSGS